MHFCMKATAKTELLFAKRYYYSSTDVMLFRGTVLRGMQNTTDYHNFTHFFGPRQWNTNPRKHARIHRGANKNPNIDNTNFEKNHKK